MYNIVKIMLTKLGKKKKGQPIQLLFDVSAISRYDMASGIERVAKAQLMGLMSTVPEYINIRPVRLCEDGKPHFCYAHKFTDMLEGKAGELRKECEVEVKEGDIFFSSDFYRDATVQAIQAGVFETWREKGVKIGYFVHDLLPLSHPEYFPEGTRETHLAWLKSIVSVSDVLTTNSQVVADALQNYIKSETLPTIGKSLHIRAVQLGFDIEASLPSRGKSGNFTSLMQQMKNRETFLMVGTIEPRKGHLQVLKAFDILWERGTDINLLIVGSEGWKGLPPEQRRSIPEIITYMNKHKALGKRLFWLEGISDELLQEFYNNSTALIAASEAEGFGIPLVEAAHHSLPVIARDIPVFHEVASSHAYYFNKSKAPISLANAIEEWLNHFKEGRHILSESMPCSSWQQSCQKILKAYKV